MYKLITDILKIPSVTEAGDIDGLVVIIYEQQTDVYSVDLDKQINPMDLILRDQI